MSLIDTMMEDCTMLDKKSVADELGSFSTKWVDGATFKAAIIKNTTNTIVVADKSDIAEVFTVTVAKGTPLDFHDVFRRDSDGATFRVTSNIKDSESPKVATFAIGQVSAERWTPS